MNTDSQWSNQEACFESAIQVWLTVKHNTSFISGELVDVRSVLHGLVSLAAVNQICVIHEAMKGFKNLKLKSCLENFNINKQSTVIVLKLRTLGVC